MALISSLFVKYCETPGWLLFYPIQGRQNRSQVSHDSYVLEDQRPEVVDAFENLSSGFKLRQELIPPLEVEAELVPLDFLVNLSDSQHQGQILERGETLSTSSSAFSCAIVSFGLSLS